MEAIEIKIKFKNLDDYVTGYIEIEDLPKFEENFRFDCTTAMYDLNFDMVTFRPLDVIYYRARCVDIDCNDQHKLACTKKLIGRNHTE